MNKQKITIQYILIIFCTVLFTWLIHEFGHWITYKLLGYDAYMSLNKAGIIDGGYKDKFHALLTSAAGPLVTLSQAIVVFWFIQHKGWNQYLYPLLFTAFYMRVLAGFFNLINLNDEGRVSVYLGLGVFTIPVIVGGVLCYMVFKVSRRYQLSLGFQFFTTVFVMLGSSILILTDQFMKIRIL